MLNASLNKKERNFFGAVLRGGNPPLLWWWGRAPGLSSHFGVAFAGFALYAKTRQRLDQSRHPPDG